MQQTRRSLAYVMLIIFIVVAPTAVSLSWYYMTRNPNLRPLGITREALRAYGESGQGVEVVAYVDWVASGSGGYSQRRLADNLITSFASKGVELRVVFRDGRDATRITYEIGRSTVGPFSVNRAAEGVQAAVEASRMY